MQDGNPRNRVDYRRPYRSGRPRSTRDLEVRDERALKYHMIDGCELSRETKCRDKNGRWFITNKSRLYRLVYNRVAEFKGMKPKWIERYGCHYHYSQAVDTKTQSSLI